ncbi:MAG: sigma-70 family RNA polymerase sigma factor [Clostridia bacterium]
MKKINLKKEYPNTSDETCEVSEKVYDALEKFSRKEHAYNEYVRYYKAYYSIDRNDGIENKIKNMSVEDFYEESILITQLHNALSKLPEIQARRIYKYYFLGYSKRKIAKEENVNSTAVGQSIKRGINNLKKNLKNFI